MATNSEIPASANLREYCGWHGNTENDIRTTGTVYHDTSSKGIKNGKRIFRDRWRAEIMIEGVRYRHRSKDPDDCKKWLKAVRMGKIKPTDNKADWLRMEQKKDQKVRFDEIIVSAAEEAMLLYGYHQTGDLDPIKDYLVNRLLPHLTYYCCNTLNLGRENSISYTRQATGLLLERITAGKPVLNFTATCKRMLKVRRKYKDFWYYENAPKDVQMVIGGLDFSQLAEVWNVTRDKRF